MQEDIYYGSAIVEVSRVNKVNKNTGVERTFKTDKLVMKGNGLTAIKQNTKLLEKICKEYKKQPSEVFVIKQLIINKNLGKSI